MEPADLTGVYREIAEMLDINTAMIMYENFKGQQIVFPQRFYSQNYVITYVRNHYNGYNLRELCQKFNYSDRRMRQILSKI